MKAKLIALTMLLCLISPANDKTITFIKQTVPLLPACQLALKACDNLVTKQKQEILVLVKDVNTNPAPSFWQSIPWPVWVLLGGVMGVGVGRLK